MQNRTKIRLWQERGTARANERQRFAGIAQNLKRKSATVHKSPQPVQNPLLCAKRRAVLHKTLPPSRSKSVSSAEWARCLNIGLAPITNPGGSPTWLPTSLAHYCRPTYPCSHSKQAKKRPLYRCLPRPRRHHESHYAKNKKQEQIIFI